MVKWKTNAATVDAVVHVGINHHIKLIALTVEFGDILHGVDYMHIIVGTTPHNQQFAFQFVGVFEWCAITVAVRVFLWSAHVSLCINGVVELP